MNIFRNYRVEFFTMILFAAVSSGCGGKSNIRPKDYFTDPQVIDLCEAAMKGDLKTIDRLVAKGVDVDRRDKHNCSKKVHFSTLGLYFQKIGLTPLHFALLGENKKSFLRLLEHKADPNIQDKNGNSIIGFVSAIEKDSEWLKMVLKHGGNPNLVDPKGSADFDTNITPLFNAMNSKNLQNVKLLVDAGANMDHQSESGKSPAMNALSCSFYEGIYFLLQVGADWKLKTKNGHDLAFLCLLRPSSKSFPTSYRYEQKILNFLKVKGVDLDAAKKAVDKHMGR